MPRVFVPKAQFPDITGSDVHYIRDVLRLKAGDELELLDGSGKVFTATIENAGKDRISCKIISSHQAESEPRTKVTLAQALPKASKMDFIIEKGVELGVHRLIPMATERTVAKTAKVDRWRKLAKEAAGQSGRAIIPEVTELFDFDSVLKMRDQFDLALIPWELEKERTLKSLLLPHFLQILLLIGPEGGFSQKEIDLAKAAGFTSISLGKRILRTETAGMAALSIIMHELG